MESGCAELMRVSIVAQRLHETAQPRLLSAQGSLHVHQRLAMLLLGRLDDLLMTPASDVPPIHVRWLMLGALGDGV